MVKHGDQLNYGKRVTVHFPFRKGGLNNYEKGGQQEEMRQAVGLAVPRRQPDLLLALYSIQCNRLPQIFGISKIYLRGEKEMAKTRTEKIV
jgi:hypothetical protein